MKVTGIHRGDIEAHRDNTRLSKLYRKMVTVMYRQYDRTNGRNTEIHEHYKRVHRDNIST